VWKIESWRPGMGASTEARSLIVQSGTADWATVDLSTEGLEALRHENCEAAAPGCDAVRAETCALVEDAEIAGVAVQWTTPRQIRGKQVVLYLHGGGGFVVGSLEDRRDLCPAGHVSRTARMRTAVPARARGVCTTTLAADP
jgi:acetyl esterase/lipase